MFSYNLRVFAYCLPWYALSVTENIVNKRFLNQYPQPLAVSVSHFIFNIVMLYPVLKGLKLPVPACNRNTIKFIFPLAIVKIFVSTMSHYGISLVAVSYANTVKSVMPLVTMLLSRQYLKETFSKQTVTAILSMIVGVSLATVTEVTFDWLGLLCIVLTMMGAVAEGFVSKMTLQALNVEPLGLLFIVHILGLPFVVILWLLAEFPYSWLAFDVANEAHVSWARSLFLSGLFSFGQHVMKFSLMHIISPVSYAVANSFKSVVIIALSLLLLKNPVGVLNLTGTTLALLGLAMYNQEKLRSPSLKPSE